ncbi:MAG: glycosyl hydrolase [Flammeovirgaceae bacterium TMED290]|nr:MAG: glycosyl hydrolase [Flammeovirgaceae bacterium TMED290]
MRRLFVITFIFLIVYNSVSQRKRNSTISTSIDKSEFSISALRLRNVGPAFLSGRIADIAIHPDNDNVWYVATGSSGVWKTENSGTTYTPIFDNETTYSTGCVTIDPSDPSIIWLGTGENVGGRHVAFGDGVFKSENGGKSWKNMGLRKSEHISEIIVHPNNSNIIWAASQGPLWSPGGERGLYKSTDGGENWKKVLGGGKWTGVTDIHMDPRNPDRIYAATWQRHRTVAALMGGGPESGLHRSEDGGDTWTELKSGLPNYAGKIGFTLSPQKPDILYASIELEKRNGAVYKSEDRGSSWKKMSDLSLGYGTGPHYYQELFASPHKFDRLYLMNVRILTSENGGKTFVELTERSKHSDNHAIAFREDDPNYLLVGTDAGIYESFDLAKTWKYHKNLPITQFYKVAVNNAYPFYHIFGGTQDNGSAGGPSRTDERQGIRNAHWYKILGADGHQTATDPEYNDIVYGEFQEGVLHRVDLKTGEAVLIQPQPREGEKHERWNWDSPILVSPHKPSRLYFASQRLWKSENRGDSWEPVSDDLTRNEERLDLPIMGRRHGFDNSWDFGAMSNYNTITSISESPVREGLIYVGTDDGIIQVTTDTGKNWKKIPVTRLGLPERTFINDIKADNFDENTVYISLDNHKEGDFSPYLFKSSDLGETWTSISSNLPKRNLIWRLVQDHIEPNLMFCATETAIYTTIDGGKKWHKLHGAPTISFRDITIQKRENDLVAASFGRGFFVLDDYTALREMSNNLTQNKEGKLFTTRDALWYIPKSTIGNTGGDYYFAENPDFGAVFTYQLSNSYPSLKSKRKELENEMIDKRQQIPPINWDLLEKESREEKTSIYILIKDSKGEEVNRVNASASKGLNRVAWDLRHGSNPIINPDRMQFRSSGSGRYSRSGNLVSPGNYTASLVKESEGKMIVLDGPMTFNVVDLGRGTLKGTSYEDYQAHSNKVDKVYDRQTLFSNKLTKTMNMVKAMRLSLHTSKKINNELGNNLFELEEELNQISVELYGNSAKSKIGENNDPTLSRFIGNAARGLSTTYGPTGQHKQSLDIANSMLTKLETKLNIVAGKIPSFKTELNNMGATKIIDGSN